MDKFNYYNILGIEIDATSAEIKTAYRRLAQKYHPDKNINDPYADEKFKEINNAYYILSNPENRQKYNSELEYNYKYSNKVRDFERNKHATTSKTNWLQSIFFYLLYMCLISVIRENTNNEIYEKKVSSFRYDSILIKNEELIINDTINLDSNIILTSSPFQ